MHQTCHVSCMHMPTIYDYDNSIMMINENLLQNALDRGKLLIEKYGPVVG